MNEFDRKAHWENIYSTKQLNEVSWYQPTPETSLELIQKLVSSPADRIIDMGGGDSFLVDHLLDNGYANITVLDISEKAIERAKTRLGARADQVKWIVSDAAEFIPEETYDIWHDRAAFHFLTQPEEVATYVQSAAKGIANDGALIIGTFSENGPLKCSGIEIQQYSEEHMAETFLAYFQKDDCFTVDHVTPFETTQNFRFCSFRKK